MIISPFLTGQLSPAPSSLWLEDGQMKQFVAVFQYQSLVMLPPSFPFFSLILWDSALPNGPVCLLTIWFCIGRFLSPYYDNLLLLPTVHLNSPTICSPIFLDSKYHTFLLLSIVHIQNLEASILKFLLLILLMYHRNSPECNTAELVSPVPSELVRGSVSSRKRLLRGWLWIFLRRERQL